MQQSRKKQNPIHEKLGEDVSTKTPAKLSKHQQKKLKKEVHKQKLQEVYLVFEYLTHAIFTGKEAQQTIKIR